MSNIIKVQDVPIGKVNGGTKYLHTGGVMRCCIHSLDVHVSNGGSEESGTIIQCIYADTPDHQLICDGESWRWNRNHD